MSAAAFDPAVDCWCCPNPAAYLWTSGKSGNRIRIRLCTGCCADWRIRATREPDLAPSRIQLLAAA